MIPVLSFPRKRLNSTESRLERASAHLPMDKTVGHHHFALTLLFHSLKINSHCKMYICLPSLNIDKCPNIQQLPLTSYPTSLCEVLRLINLIRCLPSVLRGGDECDEVADGGDVTGQLLGQCREGGEVCGQGGERACGR